MYNLEKNFIKDFMASSNFCEAWGVMSKYDELVRVTRQPFSNKTSAVATKLITYLQRAGPIVARDILESNGPKVQSELRGYPTLVREISNTSRFDVCKLIYQNSQRYQIPHIKDLAVRRTKSILASAKVAFTVEMNLNKPKKQNRDAELNKIRRQEAANARMGARLAQLRENENAKRRAANKSKQANNNLMKKRNKVRANMRNLRRMMTNRTITRVQARKGLLKVHPNKTRVTFNAGSPNNNEMKKLIANLSSM